MKPLFGVVVLAAVAFFGWRWHAGWRAETEVERFAEAWTRGDKIEAARHGEPEVVELALAKRPLRGMRGGDWIEAFRGTHYELLSRGRSSEGDVEIQVEETIRFDPPGATTGIGGAMAMRVRHAATVRRIGGGWRVVAFEPTFVDVGEIRRHAPQTPLALHP